MSDQERQQQKVREFMSLLPLTEALAGLPLSEPGRSFTEGQLENRAIAIKMAYKTARAIIKEIAS